MTKFAGVAARRLFFFPQLFDNAKSFIGGWG
jgi:hypothetical protein